MEEQREVNRWCVIAIVQQTLRYIHRRNASRLILQAIKDELVTAGCVDWQFVDILQRLLDIVRIQCGQWPYQFDILST